MQSVTSSPAYLSVLSPPSLDQEPLRNSFLKIVDVCIFRSTSADCGLCAGVTVKLFVQVDEKKSLLESSLLRDASGNSESRLRRKFHGRAAPCTDDSDWTVTASPTIPARLENLPCPYYYHAKSDVSKTLGDVFNSCFHARDTQTVQVFRSADSDRPHACSAAQASDVRDGKEGDGNIIEVPVDPVDDDLHGMTASVLSFDPRNCERKEIWLIYSQADEVTSPLRAGF